MIEWLGQTDPEKIAAPLLLTAPHSGEFVPEEGAWLRDHSELILLTDVDRFVDRLYAPVASRLQLPFLITRTHRYVADLNRYPDDVDRDSVVDAHAPSGSFPKGFHWVVTTLGQKLMRQPIEKALHERIVRKYHDTFHDEFARMTTAVRKRFPDGDLFHLDCHSMPSVGTGAHADPGQRRADVVVSDFNGRSAATAFKDLVIDSLSSAGLGVAYNNPYIGGRITQRYGRPEAGHHTIQIELNRALYMDEVTKDPLPSFDSLSARLSRAVEAIASRLKEEQFQCGLRS